MLRSGLEDYRYNSQVALSKLEALYIDSLKTTGAMPRQSSKNCRYYVHIVLKKLQVPSLGSPQKPTSTILRQPSKTYNPSFNPVHSLRKPGRICQDPESQGSCQVSFKISSRILVISVSRISHVQTGPFSEFVQVPAQIFF